MQNLLKQKESRGLLPTDTTSETWISMYAAVKAFSFQLVFG